MFRKYAASISMHTGVYVFKSYSGAYYAAFLRRGGYWMTLSDSGGLVDRPSPAIFSHYCRADEIDTEEGE